MPLLAALISQYSGGLYIFFIAAGVMATQSKTKFIINLIILFTCWGLTPGIACSAASCTVMTRHNIMTRYNIMMRVTTLV